MTGAVGIALKTADADRMFMRGRQDEPFIQLYAWVEEGKDPQVSSDPEPFLNAILGASSIYGHGVFEHHLLALAVSHPIDYLGVGSRVIDTLVAERTLNPPYPKIRQGVPVNHAALRAKGLSSADLHISYRLDAVASRYGLEAPIRLTGRKRDLSPGDLIQELRIVQKLYRMMAEKAAQAQMIDVVKREMRIELIKNNMRLHGMLVDRGEVERQVDQARRQRTEAYAFLKTAAGTPLPNSEHTWTEKAEIKIPHSTRRGRAVRARYESLFGRPCPDSRMGYRARTRTVGPSPLSTTEGRNAFEKALRSAGVKDEDIPFTPSGTLALSKHALGEDAWVKGNKSVPGLIAKYPENKQVVALCRAAIQATSASAKAEEILEYICPDGKVHPRIGDLQAAGRWAHIEPSISNTGKRGESLEQRRMIRARDGYVLVAIDLDQADPRGIAAWSKDPEYRKLTAPGMDMYREIGFRIFGSRSDEARRKVKAPLNAWTYGQGIEGAAAFTGLPREVIKRFDEGMRAAFPVLRSWRDRARQYAARTGTVPSGWGRILRITPGHEHTQAPAQIGQATTRDLLCDGLLRMDRQTLETLRLVIHDEIILEIREDLAEDITQRAVAALTTTFRGVPITCGASQPSKTWIGCYEKAA